MLAFYALRARFRAKAQAGDLRALPLALLLSACQTPSFAGQSGELDRVREENGQLREENVRLKEDIAALKAKQGDPGAAISLPASASAPASLEAQALRGRAEQDKLAAEWQNLAAAPDDPVALYLAARFSLDPDEQLSLCDKAQKIAPDFGFAHHCLSLAYQKKGDAEHALAAATRAKKLSAAVEISDNAKKLSRRGMDWFTQNLTGLAGEASATRVFSLGPATTRVSLSEVKKGLACGAEALPDDEAFGSCAGVVCLKARFSYEFSGPPDPYYDHAEVCGEALVFADREGKTLRSRTELPCSRVDSGKSISAKTVLCLPSEEVRLGSARLSIPGQSTPLTFPGALNSGAAPQ
jgi:hypothetical protein